MAPPQKDGKAVCMCCHLGWLPDGKCHLCLSMQRFLREKVDLSDRGRERIATCLDEGDRFTLRGMLLYYYYMYMGCSIDKLTLDAEIRFYIPYDRQCSLPEMIKKWGPALGTALVLIQYRLYDKKQDLLFIPIPTERVSHLFCGMVFLDQESPKDIIPSWERLIKRGEKNVANLSDRVRVESISSELNYEFEESKKHLKMLKEYYS